MKRVNYGLKEALKLKEERKRKRKELEDKGWITQRISPQVETVIEEVVEEIVEETIEEVIEEHPTPSKSFLNPHLQCDGECYTCEDNIPSHNNAPNQCGRQQAKEPIKEGPGVVKFSQTDAGDTDTIAEIPYHIQYIDQLPVKAGVYTEHKPITNKVQCPICKKLYMSQGFPKHFEACQKLDKYKKELEELEEKDGNGTND